MKILLFSNHKKRHIPPGLKKIMQVEGRGDVDDIKARTSKAVDYIEMHASSYESVMQDEALNELSSGEDVIVNYKESPLNYFVKKGSEIFCMFITDVDATRPWVIKYEKGFCAKEYVEYLD